jgi:putative hydrolase of the HAD superfamily
VAGEPGYPRPRPRLRALTFDAAGTLFVPHPGVGAVYAELACACGLERDAAQLEAAFAPAFASVRARWRVPYGANEEDARRFWAAVVEGTFGEALPYELVCELYDAFARARRWRILPGVREALALAGRHELPIAVVSNFDCRLHVLLAELDLGPFAAIVTSTMVGAAKPDPRVLLSACARMGVPPAAVLHCGDSAREDGEMAAAAGAEYLACSPELGVPLAELAARLAPT